MYILCMTMLLLHMHLFSFVQFFVMFLTSMYHIEIHFQHHISLCLHICVQSMHYTYPNKTISFQICVRDNEII